MCVCVCYKSVEPEIPLFLGCRFGVRSPLSRQWLSAGNTPGECGRPCLAEHRLWRLPCLLGFAGGDVQDQVYLPGNEKTGQDKCFAYLSFGGQMRATPAVAAIISYSFFKCSMWICFLHVPIRALGLKRGWEYDDEFWEFWEFWNIYKEGLDYISSFFLFFKFFARSSIAINISINGAILPPKEPIILQQA